MITTTTAIKSHAKVIKLVQSILANEMKLLYQERIDGDFADRRLFDAVLSLMTADKHIAEAVNALERDTEDNQ